MRGEEMEGVWLKPTRSSRMREKRADFVAGCLGGRVIVAGGLEASPLFYPLWVSPGSSSSHGNSSNQPSPLASAESYNHVKRSGIEKKKKNLNVTITLSQHCLIVFK
ncbi:hypothetical protein QTP70_001611 [Hemibagrus guttatus]|uniref:Uncharacterized protein n=1 Tax=Hemibagrus guttatus TaxID=175788 RepID=A0AAE0QDH3_9TELE|nr:hypothetical protein QTP70_001611 [Hemibagrus guttatus]